MMLTIAEIAVIASVTRGYSRRKSCPCIAVSITAMAVSELNRIVRLKYHDFVWTAIAVFPSRSIACSVDATDSQGN